MFKRLFHWCPLPTRPPRQPVPTRRSWYQSPHPLLPGTVTLDSRPAVIATTETESRRPGCGGTVRPGQGHAPGRWVPGGRTRTCRVTLPLFPFGSGKAPCDVSTFGLDPGPTVGTALNWEDGPATASAEGREPPSTRAPVDRPERASLGPRARAETLPLTLVVSSALTGALSATVPAGSCGTPESPGTYPDMNVGTVETGSPERVVQVPEWARVPPQEDRGVSDNPTVVEDPQHTHKHGHTWVRICVCDCTHRYARVHVHTQAHTCTHE